MRLSLPRRLEDEEIDDLLEALRQGEELHLDRRFSDEPSKLRMVLEEDAVRLEDRIGLDDRQTLHLVTQLSSDPLPDDFLTRLEHADHLSIRAVGGDYVIPSLKLVRGHNKNSELILTEKRYLNEDGIRTMLEESVVDMPRTLKPDELDECIKDLRNGLGLTVTGGDQSQQELLYRDDVFWVKETDGSERRWSTDEANLRSWLAARKFLSISTWISRY